MAIGKVHHGRNIRRTRIEKNIKQDVLDELVHMSQPNVYKYESARVIDDEILHRFAKALGVPFEYLKNMEENAPMVVFESNTVNNNDQANGNTTEMGYENTNNNTFNPIDKLTELYESLLKEKDEKYAALERRLESILKNGNKE